MNLYEQAICYFARAHPVILDIDGLFVPRQWGRESLPFMSDFWKVFPELRKNGMVEQVEKWPYPMYAASGACCQSAFEIWRAHGYKPVWFAPGCVGLTK
jgi:hypothetical protein